MTGRVARLAFPIALLQVGCASSDERSLRVVRSFAPEVLAVGDTATATMAVYLVIANSGDADTLDAVSSPIASRAAIHGEMNHGGMRMMMPTEHVEVPAFGALRLMPVVRHIMLEALTTRPRAGDSITVTLTLRTAGQVRTVVPVIPYASVDSASRKPYP